MPLARVCVDMLSLMLVLVSMADHRPLDLVDAGDVEISNAVHVTLAGCWEPWHLEPHLNDREGDI
eukprot:1612087-Pyramimonas_sp.AAC.1